mmetsp:Transcript_15495/g.30483  ORF Transcript_15495/g.30483 Transcript_15495/m.30483 type:complete len:200 (+) Transcript_15495:1997-2596(+)
MSLLHICCAARRLWQAFSKRREFMTTLLKRLWCRFAMARWMMKRRWEEMGKARSCLPKKRRSSGYTQVRNNWALTKKYWKRARSFGKLARSRSLALRFSAPLDCSKGSATTLCVYCLRQSQELGQTCCQSAQGMWRLRHKNWLWCQLRCQMKASRLGPPAVVVMMLLPQQMMPGQAVLQKCFSASCLAMRMQSGHRVRS